MEICCSYLPLFFCSVSAFQEDVSHCPTSISTSASVGLSLTDGEQIGTKAGVAGTHLRDDRADGSIFAAVGIRQSWVLKAILTRISLQHICSYSLRAYMQALLLDNTSESHENLLYLTEQYGAVLFSTATYLDLEIEARVDVHNNSVGPVCQRRRLQVGVRPRRSAELDFALA